MLDNNTQSLSTLTGNSGGTQQFTDQMIRDLQNTLAPFLIISVIVTFVIVIYLVISAVHKWRVQSAILRIDSNLQKLVDLGLKHGSPQEGSVSTTPQEDIEQK